MNAVRAVSVVVIEELPDGTVGVLTAPKMVDPVLDVRHSEEAEPLGICRIPRQKPPVFRLSGELLATSEGYAYAVEVVEDFDAAMAVVARRLGSAA